MIREMYWLLYKMGIYKAEVIGDGVTNNQMAFQARLDAGESMIPDNSKDGDVYYFTGTIYAQSRSVHGSNVTITGKKEDKENGKPEYY